jgi:hypothetical protein
VTDPESAGASENGASNPDGPPGWLRRLGEAFGRPSADESKSPPPGPDPQVFPRIDPVEAALARVREADPRSFEAAVVRGALEIPGVLGGILFEAREEGGLAAVAAAGGRPPTEEDARRAADHAASPPGSAVLAVSVSGWGESPGYRLAVAIDVDAAPAGVVDRLERYARLAAPFLAAGAGAKRTAETQERYDAIARELCAVRRAKQGEALHAIVGRIATRVATELADPLGSVLGCSRALAEASEEEAREALVGDLVEASTRGREIVEHLASLCALEGAGDWRAFPARAVLEEAFASASPALRAAGVEVVRRLEKDLPEIEGDRELLRLALANAALAIGEGFEIAGPRRVFAFEAGRVPQGLRIHMSCEGTDPPAAPAARWPATERNRLGWWVSQEIFRGLQARVQARGWDEGLPSLTLALPAARAAPGGPNAA